MSRRPFALFNTLHRKAEPIELREEGHLRMYSCGPTVYTTAHIGNFRSFLTADLILRTARAIGWRTSYVSNITDVGHLTEDDVADASGEDKMTRALKSKDGERFANIYDLARHYTELLTADWKALNLLEPDVRPRATEHITDQIDAIEKLIEDGHAYVTDKGVYFSVPSFPNYGRLSGNEAAENLEHLVRDVVKDDDKRDPRDFALWKRDDKHLMQWYSPFGRGFPGWHIECSVMAMRYLGETIDIHAGGEDLIFPHHECEIAQSESLTDKPFANHWVHTRFLQVEGEKMSKSTGNFFTVRELIAPESEGGRGIDALALRLTLISGQYRKPFNFTKKTLADSIRIRERYAEALKKVEAALEDSKDGADRMGDRLDAIYERTLDAMLDDLNTPAALAAALEGVKLISGMASNLNRTSAEAAMRWFENTNALLGIVWADEPHAAEDGPADPLADLVEARIQDRKQARAEKDFARADAIRDELAALGVELMDSPQGTTWKRRTSI
jgi:cysteinyl-tRNA synthetase